MRFYYRKEINNTHSSNKQLIPEVRAAHIDQFLIVHFHIIANIVSDLFFVVFLFTAQHQQQQQTSVELHVLCVLCPSVRPLYRLPCVSHGNLPVWSPATSQRIFLQATRPSELVSGIPKPAAAAAAAVGSRSPMRYRWPHTMHLETFDRWSLAGVVLPGYGCHVARCTLRLLITSENDAMPRAWQTQTKEVT